MLLLRASVIRLPSCSGWGLLASFSGILWCYRPLLLVAATLGKKKDQLRVLQHIFIDGKGTHLP